MLLAAFLSFDSIRLCTWSAEYTVNCEDEPPDYFYMAWEYTHVSKSISQHEWEEFSINWEDVGLSGSWLSTMYFRSI